MGDLTAAVRRPGRTGLRGRNLSQTIPAPHDRLLQPYRQLGISDTGLHRATCVLLYQRCEATVTREEAATALGYDRPAAADNAVARLQGKLQEAGLTAAFEETLDHLEAALAGEPPIDWTARLAALNGWTVPPDDWAVLRADLMPLQKRHGRQPDWDLRRLVISQIIWEDITRGEPHRSPAFAAIGTNEDARTRLRTTTRQFRRNVEDGLLPGFAPVLRAYRDQVEASITGDQPMPPPRSANAAECLTGPSADSRLRAAYIDYLVSQTMGRVATVGADGMPCVEPTPLRYNRELGTVDIGGPQVANTNRYRKVQANRWAAIVIDDVVSLDPWTPRYLEIRGHAETIPSGGGHLGRGSADAFIRIHPKEITSLGIP
jgi:pyridoxamine 5'-phosphate oxidase family protein